MILCAKENLRKKNPLYNRVALLMKSWIQQCQHKENVKVKSERQTPPWTSIIKNKGRNVIYMYDQYVKYSTPYTDRKTSFSSVKQHDFIIQILHIFINTSTGLWKETLHFTITCTDLVVQCTSSCPTLFLSFKCFLNPSFNELLLISWDKQTNLKAMHKQHYNN